MKTMSIIIAVGLMNVTLFTGCKKDDQMMGTAANNNTTTAMDGKVIPNKEKTLVSYQLQINAPASQAPFQWQKSVANVSEVHFIIASVKSVPEDLPAQDYFRAANMQIQVFQPAQFEPVIVQSGVYKSIDLQVMLSPLNGPALVLTGLYRMTNRVVNADLIIGDQVTLHGIVTHDAYNIDITSRRMAATLTGNIDAIMSGISADLLNNATIENNTLTISPQSNAQLYAAVLASLRAMPLAVQLSAIRNPDYIKEANTK